MDNKFGSKPSITHQIIGQSPKPNQGLPSQSLTTQHLGKIWDLQLTPRSEHILTIAWVAFFVAPLAQGIYLYETHCMNITDKCSTYRVWFEEKNTHILEQQGETVLFLCRLPKEAMCLENQEFAKYFWLSLQSTYKWPKKICKDAKKLVL